MALTIADDMWREHLAAPGLEYNAEIAAIAFARLPELAEAAHFTPEEQANLTQTISSVSTDPEQLSVWYKVVLLLSQRNETGNQLCGRDPGFGGSMNDPYGFNLLVLLGMIPVMEQLYREKGWYEELWAEALLDIRIWMDFCRANNDSFGISFGFAWIRYQMVGAVMRLGRLQCNDDGGFYHEYRVYRNKKDCSYCALMDCAMNFRKDGFSAFPDEDAAFTTAPVTEDEQGYTGWKCTGNGLVHPEKITLAKTDWEEFLKPDDPVIHLHIPADGPLLPEQALDSCRKMLKFHREVLKRDPKAFVCESWLLDPMFAQLLPPTSNILKFQQLGYRMPGPAGESELVRRVFGEKAVKGGLDAVPHKTSMQRTFADYLKGGGHARNGAFFIPLEMI